MEYVIEALVKLMVEEAAIPAVPPSVPHNPVQGEDVVRREGMSIQTRSVLAGEADFFLLQREQHLQVGTHLSR